MDKPKFVVFIDHLAAYNNKDCYVSIDGKDILEAIRNFNECFNTYELSNRVYLYKMMQKVGNTTVYKDILINRGHGWDVENYPIEQDLKNKIVNCYVAKNFI